MASWPGGPLPVASAADTTIPDCATGLPAASRSWIAGCWESGTPFCAELVGWVVMESAAGAPALRTIGVEGAPVRPAELNPIVTLPVAPMTARLVKVAVPAALVVTVVAPVSEPLPDAIARSEEHTTELQSR